MAINALVEELNAAGVHDNYLSVGSYLSRNKWGHICEDAEAPIESSETRSGLAVASIPAVCKAAATASGANAGPARRSIEPICLRRWPNARATTC